MGEKQRKELGQIVFHIFNNGHIQVSGPIDNYVLVMDVIGRGITALAQHHLKKQQDEHPIIKPSPNIVLPGNQ